MLSLEGVIRSRYGLVKYGFDAMQAHSARLRDRSVPPNQFSCSAEADELLEEYMGFQVYDGPLIGHRLSTAVTVCKDGTIKFSQYLGKKYKMECGAPVRFHFDSGRTALAIELVEKHATEPAHHSFIRKVAFRYSIAAKNLLQHYNLPIPQYGCSATEEEVWGKKLMVIQLRKAAKNQPENPK